MQVALTLMKLYHDTVTIQAQALLAKNILYQKLDVALQKLTTFFQPAVYSNVPRCTTDSDAISAMHRDAAVANLRFLNIFFNYGHDTFAHSANLLDRLVGQVKVRAT